MDQRITWIENEVIALSKSFEAVQSQLDTWKQNQQIPEPSIRAMKLYVNGMRRNLASIDEILDSTDD